MPETCLITVVLLYSGPGSTENLENENGHGKGMAQLKKSHEIVISHGILPIFPPDSTKLCSFC